MGHSGNTGVTHSGNTGVTHSGNTGVTQVTWGSHRGHSLRQLEVTQVIASYPKPKVQQQ